MVRSGPPESTLEDDRLQRRTDKAEPGMLVVFSEQQPACVAVRLGSKPLTLGRELSDQVFGVQDHRVSRKHVRVSAHGSGVHVTDLSSRNGTYVDGAQVKDEVFRALPRVLRVGHTLLRFVPDIRPYLNHGVERVGTEIVGPLLRRSRQSIQRVAESERTLLITGASGTGKELAARAFHRFAGREQGPFIAVNCAAIPEGLAERLFFGTQRGAYSGADSAAEGYLQAADGGTLFLDEIAELDRTVQPKLLRVLETRDVLPLGAVRSKPIDVRLCAATLKNLRTEVELGRFREDLFFRLAQPEVSLPTLAERLEDLPWLLVDELKRLNPELTARATFVEACLLRNWPGNVRELLSEVREAGQSALADGRHEVESSDLAVQAGQPATPETSGELAALSRSDVEKALQSSRGNVSGAARALGMHRNQLRRWLLQHGIDPKHFSEDP